MFLWYRRRGERLALLAWFLGLVTGAAVVNLWRF